jgi:MscS family membrane protein
MHPTRPKSIAGSSIGRALAALFFAVNVGALGEGRVAGQDPGATGAQPLSEVVLAARTDSPRQTLQSFLDAIRKAEGLYVTYGRDRTHATVRLITANTRVWIDLLDLSQVAPALRDETGFRASYALADVLARVELPPMESVPDWDPFDHSAPDKWRVPGTPITIARIDEGPRAGEFLFSASTVASAPRLYERARHLPLQRPSPVESWTDMVPHVTGPWIPAGLADAVPMYLRKSRLDTPIWKILISIVTLGVAAVLFVLINHYVRRQPFDSLLRKSIGMMVMPLSGIALAWLVWLFLQYEVNVSGAFAKLSDSALTAINNIALAWLFWLAVLAAAEWMIRSPRIPDESLNASLMRLSARLIGFVGVILILAWGANRLGLPVLGVVAGLGFGGLAVALAIRPTLENLVGGVILFTDRPVRVGDLCSFGDRMGRVERIGIRSTKIRAMDRTLISIPNATFVDLELVNWAECDRMLILTVIGLRYETTPEQLRDVLAKLRDMFSAHPKIEASTVRVRFVGYGASSADVQIRVYALTREWNEFFAIREDVLLRASEIVRESGTSLALPSRTLYFGGED